MKKISNIENIHLARTLYNRKVELDEFQEKLKLEERVLQEKQKVIGEFLSKYYSMDCNCECKCPLHTANRKIPMRVINAFQNRKK